MEGSNTKVEKNEGRQKRRQVAAHLQTESVRKKRRSDSDFFFPLNQSPSPSRWGFCCELVSTVQTANNNLSLKCRNIEQHNLITVFSCLTVIVRKNLALKSKSNSFCQSHLKIHSEFSREDHAAAQSG